jgi:predicted nucleic acid-binding protein
MKVIITDVSVLFDLFSVNILPEFFALDVEICMTIFVYNEVMRGAQISEFETFKRTKKLTVLELTAEEQEAIAAFEPKRSLKSFPDKTMLWKAIQLNCPLLTCDNKLRNEANDHGVEVHGSIWVIGELVKQGIINNSKAIEVLNKLKTENNRLPTDEIDKIIKVYKN